MKRTEHIHGSLLDGDAVILDDVDGYLTCHEQRSGRKTLYGHFELSCDRIGPLSHERRYHLVLRDGRNGDVFTEVVPSNVPGATVVEFHVVGALRK